MENPVQARASFTVGTMATMCITVAVFLLGRYLAPFGNFGVTESVALSCVLSLVAVLLVPDLAARRMGSRRELFVGSRLRREAARARAAGIVAGLWLGAMVLFVTR